MPIRGFEQALEEQLRTETVYRVLTRYHKDINVEYRSGKLVKVEGAKKSLFIMSDSHRWNGGQYKTDMYIKFESI